MFKLIFPLTLLLNLTVWYSPYGWGATYGPHPGRNLTLSGVLFAVVFFLILSELQGWQKGRYFPRSIASCLQLFSKSGYQRLAHGVAWRPDSSIQKTERRPGDDCRVALVVRRDADLSLL
jgi:hypothetical protein